MNRDEVFSDFGFIRKNLKQFICTMRSFILHVVYSPTSPKLSTDKQMWSCSHFKLYIFQFKNLKMQTYILFSLSSYYERYTIYDLQQQTYICFIRAFVRRQKSYGEEFSVQSNTEEVCRFCHYDDNDLRPAH